MKDLKVRLLALELLARNLQRDYDNQYAQAHLEEVELLLRGAIVQLKYAELAHEGLD